MKLNKTFLFAVVTLLIVMAVYVFDYKREIKNEEIEKALIVPGGLDQINYIQIFKDGQKIAAQKGDSGWTLIEPVQDKADSGSIEDLLKDFTEQKQISIVKKSDAPISQDELKEFGLDKPAVIFNFKNNLGVTKKISVGSIKNFEGNSFIRVDADNKIILAGPTWANNAENNLIYYREKRLYRGWAADLVRINVKSLQDQFTIEKSNGVWAAAAKYDLDQNKVRELIKKMSETTIQEYLFEGEPSVTFLKQHGLLSNPIKIELQTSENIWTAALNVHAGDKALYAVTERPTFVVKLELGAWELFGNLNLDSLRDRTSAFNFKTEDVKRVFFKSAKGEVSLENKNGSWVAIGTADSSVEIDAKKVTQIINRAHDLKVSEFLDGEKSRKSSALDNILIFKSATDSLILQLNWMPALKIKKLGVEKDYYYARTQLSDFTFAIEKQILDSLGLDEVFDKDRNSDKEQKKESSDEQ